MKARAPKPPRLPRNPNKTSSRRTSKLWLMINSGIAWLAILYAIFNGLTDVAVAGLSFVTLQYAFYVGIGHLDYRQLVLSLMRHQPDLSTSTTTTAAVVVDPPTT